MTGSRTRLAMMAAGIALLATTGVMAASGAASADTVVNAKYAVTGNHLHRQAQYDGEPRFGKPRRHG